MNRWKRYLVTSLFNISPQAPLTVKEPLVYKTYYDLGESVYDLFIPNMENNTVLAEYILWAQFRLSK